MNGGHMEGRGFNNKGYKSLSAGAISIGGNPSITINDGYISSRYADIFYFNDGAKYDAAKQVIHSGRFESNGDNSKVLSIAGAYMNVEKPRVKIENGFLYTMHESSNYFLPPEDVEFVEKSDYKLVIRPKYDESLNIESTGGKTLEDGMTWKAGDSVKVKLSATPTFTQNILGDYASMSTDGGADKRKSTYQFFDYYIGLYELNVSQSQANQKMLWQHKERKYSDAPETWTVDLATLTDNTGTAGSTKKIFDMMEPEKEYDLTILVNEEWQGADRTQPVNVVHGLKNYRINTFGSTVKSIQITANNPCRTDSLKARNNELKISAQLSEFVESTDIYYADYDGNRLTDSFPQSGQNVYVCGEVKVKPGTFKTKTVLGKTSYDVDVRINGSIMHEDYYKINGDTMTFRYPLSFKEPIPIKKVVISGLDEPTIGQKQDRDFYAYGILANGSTVSFESKSIVYRSRRDNNSSYETVPTNWSFIEGDQVHVSVTLTAKPGYTFEWDDNQKYTGEIYSNPLSMRKVSGFDSGLGKGMKLSLAYTKYTLTKPSIDNVELTDFLFPYVGERNEADITALSDREAGITASVKWTDENGTVLDKGALFEDKEYNYTIVLKSDKEYSFKHNESTGELTGKITLNGESLPEDCEFRFNALSYSVLTITGTYKPEPKTKIQDITITGVETPIAGILPASEFSLVIKDENGKEIDASKAVAHKEIIWTNVGSGEELEEDEAFVKDEEYYFYILLSPARGFYFPGDEGKEKEGEFDGSIEGIPVNEYLGYTPYVTSYGKLAICSKEYSTADFYIYGPREVSATKSIQLADVFDFGGEVRKVTWGFAKESDKDYATITSTGKLTAKNVTSARKVTVQAVAEGTELSSEQTAYYEVYVYPLVTKVELESYDLKSAGVDTSKATWNVDYRKIQSFYIDWSMAPYDANDKATFSSSNTKIAKIDSNGYVELTGKSGSVAITVKAADGSGKSRKVTIKVRTSVEEGCFSITAPGMYYDSYGDESVDIIVKNSVQLKTEFVPFMGSQVTNKEVTWELCNPDDSKYITLTNTGKVTVKKEKTEGDPWIGIAAVSKENKEIKAYFYVYIIPTTGSVELYQIDAAGLWNTDADTLRQFLIDAGGNINIQTEKATLLPSGGTKKIDYRKDKTIYLCGLAKTKDLAGYTQTMKYKSSNTKIATVDENGRVNFTGKDGKVKITATVTDGSGKNASFTFDVFKSVSSFTLQSKNMGSKEIAGESTPVSYVAKGKSLPLEAVFEKTADGKMPSNVKLTWSTSDKTVATVDAKGKVTAKANATAGNFVDITATSVSDPSVTATHRVYVKDIGELSVKATVCTKSGENQKDYTKDELLQNGIVVNLNEIPDVTGVQLARVGTESSLYTCKSSNTKVAKVTNPYVPFVELTGTDGKAEITLTATDGSGKTVKFNLQTRHGVSGMRIDEPQNAVYRLGYSNVPEPFKNELEKLGFQSADIQNRKYSVSEICTGKSIQLKVRFDDAKVTNKNVTWTSSDKTIATVDSKGKVTAKSKPYIVDEFGNKKPAVVKITATSVSDPDVSACQYFIIGDPFTVSLDIYGERINEEIYLESYLMEESVQNKTINIDAREFYGNMIQDCVEVEDDADHFIDMSEGFTIRMDINHSDTIEGLGNDIYPVVKESNIWKRTRLKDAGAYEIEWTSGNKKIAHFYDGEDKVRRNNSNYVEVLLTGKPGKVVITGKLLDGSNKTVKVTLNVFTSVQKGEDGLKLKVKGSVDTSIGGNVTTGQSIQLEPVFTPKTPDPRGDEAVGDSEVTNQKVTWKSSDKTVATVDSKGKVTAKGKSGTAVITATSEEDKTVQASYTVTVIPKSTKVSIYKKTPIVSMPDTLVSGKTVNVGYSKLVVKSMKLKAQTVPEAASDSVKWTSGNKKIATVDADGNVTFTGKAGTVTITATTTDGSKKSANVKFKVYN